jgi:HlyD family secretion protein
VKRVLLIAGGILVLAALVVAGIRQGGKEKGTKVYAEAAARRDISEVIKATGEIDPREKVNISAHVVGKIEKLYVKEGDEIRAGRPFLELEKQAYVAQRDQWAAQLRSMQTGVRKAEVMLADAKVKGDRARRLSQEGIATRQDLETAELQESSAKLALDEAHEAVHQTQANLEKAKDDLSKTTIYAPLTGRVIKLNAEEGEVVVSGTMNNPGSVIGTIADLSEILAKVDVDETEIVDVAVGQQAVLKVDALPGREYRGRVVEVGSSGSSKAAQPDVTFFEVKILMENADAALRPGMSVRAEIQAKTHEKAVVVPIQAVVERPPLGGEGKTASAAPAAAGSDGDEEVKVVFTVEKTGKGAKVHQREVATGISDETHVEILSGLKSGETVVSGPYRTLRDLKDGAKVRISQTSEAEDKKKADEKAKEDGN